MGKIKNILVILSNIKCSLNLTIGAFFLKVKKKIAIENDGGTKHVFLSPFSFFSFFDLSRIKNGQMFFVA